MNILHLAHRIPFPPNKGDKLRAFRQIEHLSKRHRVWCACFVDTPGDYRYVSDLREFCEDVAAIEIRPVLAKARGLWNLLRGGTVTEGFYRNRDMTETLQRWSKAIPFDVVVAFSSSMATYALEIPAPRRVLDVCDRDSQKWLDYAERRRGLVRRIFQTEGTRLAARELRWIDAFDAAILITATEAAPLRELVAPRKLHIVGNGVALPALSEAAESIRPTVGFVGVMDYGPNVDAVCWFARECWPMIRSVQPAAAFRIVGRNPVRAVRRLATIPGVQVIGGVDDVARELNHFDVSVAPLRIARGIQNKVLEAMAAVKPVVLTTKAASGIGAENGRDYLVADTPPAIAGAVRDLLDDPTLRARIGESGRQFVAERHRWETEMARLEEILSQAATRPVTAALGSLGSGLIELGVPMSHRRPEEVPSLVGASETSPR